MTGTDPDSNATLRRSATGRASVHDDEVSRLVDAMHGERGSAKKRASWSGRSRSKRRNPKRRRLATAILTLALALSLIGIGTWYASPELITNVAGSIAEEQFPAPSSKVIANDSDRWSAGYPPRGVEAETSPLGEPAPLTQTSDSHVFIGADEQGTFAAYDPCRPIHYVTRPDNAPPGGQHLITDAVAAASEATGLVFIDDGATSESFNSERSVYQPELYGERWAPVLIVWETPKEEPRFVVSGNPGDMNLAGLGGSQPIVGDAGSRVLVTGSVQLNAASFAKMLTMPNGTALASGIIQHELGHVLGLGHVQDPGQLMYEHGQTEITTYAAGDLTGLAELGQGKCFANH